MRPNMLIERPSSGPSPRGLGASARVVSLPAAVAVALALACGGGCEQEHPGQRVGEYSGRPERGSPTPGTAYDLNPDGTGTPASAPGGPTGAVSGRNTGSGPAEHPNDPSRTEGAAGAEDSRGAAAHATDSPEQTAQTGSTAPGDPAASTSRSEPLSGSESESGSRPSPSIEPAEPEPAEPEPADQPQADPSGPVPVDPEPDEPGGPGTS